MKQESRCAYKHIYFPPTQGLVLAHQELIDTCLAHNDFNLKTVGRNLRWLRVRRNFCDYDDDLQTTLIGTDLVGAAEEAVDRVDEIYRLLDDLDATL